MWVGNVGDTGIDHCEIIEKIIEILDMDIQHIEKTMRL